MELIENIFMLLGVALCVLALLPLGLWTAQSLSALSYNRKQFAISQETMRQQILQSVGPTESAATTVAVNSIASKLPTEVATERVGAASSSPASQALKGELLPVLNAASVSSPVAATPAQSVASPFHSQSNRTQPVAVASAPRGEVASDGNWSGSRPFRVAKLVKETTNCTSVYLTPADDKPIVTFRPGQHLSLKFMIPGQSKPVYRCYSLSDGPNKLCYRISVKATQAIGDAPPGLVSNFVNQQLQEGDIIEARSPAGAFTLDTKDSRTVVMLAGGIGVTPMISMIEELTAQFPDRIAILVYGVRNKADQAFQSYLRSMSAAHRNLHVVNCYSDPAPSDVQGEDFQIKGFVSVELLEQLLSNKDCQYYLCGPPPFMKSLGDGLAAWSIPDSQIFSETFGPAAIKRKSTASSESDERSKPVAASPVTFGVSGKTVTWSSDHDSLLDLAEANGVDIPFGCRAGSCGTCATALVSGEVDYPEGQDVLCESGECLTCVARPRGSIELGA